MKILVGVDGDFDGATRETVSPVVGLLERLRFPAAAYTVARVLQPNGAIFFGMEALGLERLDKVQQSYVAGLDKAEMQVDAVAAELRGIAETVDPMVLSGNPVGRLLELADGPAGIDLIAVNASQSPTPLAALLTGSVARALVVTASQSVLIARSRGGEATNTPVRAVLATDHSAYANRCVELLCRFAPAGLKHLSVVSAYHAARLRQVGALAGGHAVDTADAVRDDLSARNDTILQILARRLPNDATFVSRVVDAPVSEAIAQVMEQDHADLLILGAKGHSFVERTLLGSISFHHAVVHAPHSVLILRA